MINLIWQFILHLYPNVIHFMLYSGSWLCFNPFYTGHNQWWHYLHKLNGELWTAGFMAGSNMQSCRMKTPHGWLSVEVSLTLHQLGNLIQMHQADGSCLHCPEDTYRSMLSIQGLLRCNKQEIQKEGISIWFSVNQRVFECCNKGGLAHVCS